jgi:rhomboid family GlyGly-CTERM serine protease
MNATNDTKKASDRLQFFVLPIGIAMLSTGCTFGGITLARLLRYDRDAILAGQLWRLLTGHLVHLGGSHLVMNLVGLALIWMLFGRLMSTAAWLATLLSSALTVSLGLLVFNPELMWYVGLSGVLHGMFLAGAILSIVSGYRAEILLLGFIVAKLVWEHWVGPLPGSAEVAGGNVVVDAHLYGAIAGVVVALVIVLWRHFGAPPSAA